MVLQIDGAYLSPRPVGLWDHERSSVYIVSKQGNTNLVLSREDGEFFENLDRARAFAEQRSKDEGVNYFVHQATAKLLFAFRVRRQVDVKAY